MNAVTTRRSVSPVAVVAALLATLMLVVLPASRAAAHDQMIGSDPASGASVETLPEEISLSFSAALIEAPDGTEVRVTDPAGNVVSTGAAEIDGAIVRQGLDVSGAPAGEYTVQWAVVSSDGHPTDGEFSFSVTTGAEPTETAPEASDDQVTEPGEVEDPGTTAEDPGMEAGFSLSTPWIIAIAVVALIVVFLLVVLIARRRGPRHPDSRTPAER